jgi:hypothetical protein
MKKGIDKRTRLYKRITRWKTYAFSPEMLCTLILALLAAFILTKTLWDLNHAPLLTPLVRTGLVKVQVVEAKDTRWCDSPIKCIRDVGEQLGESNQDIMTMIRLAKCESTMNPNAYHVNKNGSVDRGLLQINSVHKGLSNADAFDTEKNIRFAFKLHRDQKHSFRAWSCLKVINK